jgi:hypothetical protein
MYFVVEDSTKGLLADLLFLAELFDFFLIDTLA